MGCVAAKHVPVLVEVRVRGECELVVLNCQLQWQVTGCVVSRHLLEVLRTC